METGARVPCFVSVMEHAELRHHHCPMSTRDNKQEETDPAVAAAGAILMLK